MSNLKRSFPIKDGWLHLTVHLKNGAQVSQEQMLATLGFRPDACEIAEYWHGKSRARLIVRKKREEVVPDVIEGAWDFVAGDDNRHIDLPPYLEQPV